MEQDSLVQHKKDQVKMIGMDFGSTTSSAMVAVAGVGLNSITGRMAFSDPEVVYRSQVEFTPFKDGEIDATAIAKLLDSWLEQDQNLFSGGVIITGLAALRSNADHIAKLVKERIGEAVIATVDDPNLESWLAFMGCSTLLSRHYSDRTLVNLDIGGGTTDVAIFHEGIIRHTAVIPYGGNVITQDIKKGCKILERHAENLKVKFGSAVAKKSSENEVVCIPGLKGQQPKEITLKTLAHIIESRMTEIILLVKQQIDNSGYADEIIGGIVVTGGGSKLKHLTQLFDYKTGMSSRIGYPCEHLANENDQNLMSPMYSTGIGLVLKGFEKGNSMSIVNKEEEEVDDHRGEFFTKVLDGIKGFFGDEEEDREEENGKEKKN